MSHLEQKYAEGRTAESRGELTLLGKELDDKRGGGEGEAATKHEGGWRSDAAYAGSDRTNDDASDEKLR